jgi:hypothetical protein
LSSTLQETVPPVVTSTDETVSEPTPKALDAEEVTTIATIFLRRIGHKGKLQPKRVSMEEDLFTVEVEMKKHNAVVKISVLTREIKEYDVTPKNEEGSASLNPKFIITVSIISAVVCAVLYFGFKMMGM